MKLLVFCLASVLISASSAIPVRGGFVDKPVIAFYLLPKSELASFSAMKVPLGEYVKEVEEDPEAFLSDGVQTLIVDGEMPSEDGREPVGLARSRRSTQPRENGDQGNDGRGNIDAGVSRTRDGGTRVEASGQGTVWESRDRRGRVDVHGHYERDFGGRHGTGRANYGGGVRYRHRF